MFLAHGGMMSNLQTTEEKTVINTNDFHYIAEKDVYIFGGMSYVLGVVLSAIITEAGGAYVANFIFGLVVGAGAVSVFLLRPSLISFFHLILSPIVALSRLLNSFFESLESNENMQDEDEIRKELCRTVVISNVVTLFLFAVFSIIGGVTIPIWFLYLISIGVSAGHVVLTELPTKYLKLFPLWPALLGGWMLSRVGDGTSRMLRSYTESKCQKRLEKHLGRIIDDEQKALTTS